MALDKDALASRLGSHVGVGRGAGSDDYVQQCVAEAIELVKQHVGPVSVVPEAILQRAVVECGADLYWRRQARSGVATFDSEGALETVRIGLDPMRSARAVLAPYLGVPIA